ncbi:Uncharacterized protein dnm_038750 [Desulfonema magnum]|uniref:Uncharacterized protein n=1 Tax=Desulfonema magnum TaxID=45655 RepID=A0A975GPE9_9BACT|nr:Uncharacterized protein dnm_038750 [Desulfonema magnum]
MVKISIGRMTYESFDTLACRTNINSVQIGKNQFAKCCEGAVGYASGT